MREGPSIRYSYSPPSSHSGDRRWLAEADFARSVAIIWIVLHHMVEYLPSNPLAGGVAGRIDDALTALALGAIFFVSGLVVSRRRKPMESFAAGLSFLGRRLLRLYPLYLLALAAFIAVRIVIPGPADLVSYATLTQALLAPRWVDPTRTLWYVSVTFWLYAIYAFTVGRRRSTVSWAIVATAVGVFVLLHEFLDVIDVRLIVYATPFFAGVWFAGREKVDSDLDWRVLAGTAPVVVLLLLVYDPAQEVQEIQYATQTALIIASLPLLWWASGKACASAAVRSASGRVGYASYAAYLLHRPAFELVVAVGLGPLGLVAALPVIAIGSWGVQRAYERAVRSLLR